MQKKRLGASDIMVAPISIGSWSFGGQEGDYWGARDQRDVQRVVDLAIELGANFFDTAYGYNDGRSEISLGQALKGKRERAYVCTKTPILKTPGEFEEKLAASLKRLDMEYVDVLMIHWPTRDRALLEQNLLSLKKAVDKGYARFAGVSNFARETMEIAKDLGLALVANEFCYSLISRAPEYEVLPYCVEHDIGVTCYLSLMQGILTGKYRSIGEIPENYRRTIQFDGEKNSLVGKAHPVPHAEAEILAVIEKQREIAADLSVTPGQLALAWCASKPGVATMFVGCRDENQLRDNVRAGELTLSADVIRALDEVSLPVLNKSGNTTDVWGRDRIW